MSVTKVTAAAIVGAATLGLTLASAAVDPHAGHAKAAAAAGTPATPASAKAVTPAPAAPAGSAAGAATPATTTPASAKAATPTSTVPAAAGATVDPAKGRELFANWSCGSCHALEDAGGSGHVGPAFDGNPNLSEALVVDRVTNGQGAMPAFGGQMTDEEIATIAKYITHYAAK